MFTSTDRPSLSSVSFMAYLYLWVGYKLGGYLLVELRRLHSLCYTNVILVINFKNAIYCQYVCFSGLSLDRLHVCTVMNFFNNVGGY